jgi:hypothetical protein
MEIVQNVAEYVPRGLRDMTAAYLCEGFVNDRTVTAEAASAMAMKASGDLIVRVTVLDDIGAIVPWPRIEILACAPPLC